MLDCHLISIFGYSSSIKLNNICRDLTDKHLSGTHHCSVQQVHSALQSFSDRGWLVLTFISRPEGASDWREVVGCHLLSLVQGWSTAGNGNGLAGAEAVHASHCIAAAVQLN